MNPAQRETEAPSSPPPAAPPAFLADPRARLLAAAAFALAVGTTQMGPLRSPDLFWNLQLGRVMLTQRSLPVEDPLTHTAEAKRATYHEWGSQVLLAAVDRAGGPWALRTLRAALLALFLLLVGIALSRVVRTPEAVLLGQLAVWLPLLPRAFLRPHLLGWVILAALVVWLGGRGRSVWRSRHFAVLFLATIAWVNLHSSALLLPVLLGILTLETVAWGLLGRTRSIPEAASFTCRVEHVRLGWRPLLGAAAITGAAALAQPAGFSLLSYTRRTGALNREFSTEWLPLLRADVWRQYPEVLLLTLGLGLLLLVSLALRLVRARGTIGGAAGPPRTIPFPGALFSLTVVGAALWTRRATELLWLPILYTWAEGSALCSARQGIAISVGSGRSPSGWIRWAFAATLLIAAAALSLRNRGEVFSLRPYARGRFPEEASRFLAETQLKGNLFNADGWGGFLSYKLYPRYHTFLDGRLPLAGRKLIEDSHQILLRSRDPASTLNRHAIEVLVEPTRIYIRTRALDSASFELAWVDEVAMVLLRAGPHLATNHRRVCAYYRRHPSQRVHAYWAFRVRVPRGSMSPTDIPLAVRHCDENTPLR